MPTRRQTLSKSERLCSESRIDALFSRGRRGNVGPLRFCWAVTPAADSAAQNAGQPAARVSVLFSAPKKAFKRAWKRNLIKRRMRESYRQRKHELVAAAEAAGQHIDIALICFPEGAKVGRTGVKGSRTGEKRGTAGVKGAEVVKGVKGAQAGAKGAEVVKGAKGGRAGAKEAAVTIEIPDFKTIDDAIAKILEQITARTRA